MKALKEKIRTEYWIGRSLKESAWQEKNFDKAVELRMKQQENWEKFNFMKELDKAIERKER